MKIFLLHLTAAAFILGLSNNLEVFAQRYSITPSKEVTGVWSDDMEQLEISVHFLNTTDEDFNTNWTLGQTTLPDIWQPSMCDNQICLDFVQLFGKVKTMKIAKKTAPEYMQGLLKLAVKPKNETGEVMSGTGFVKVMIHDVMSANVIDTIIFTANVGVTSVDEQQNSVEISPNPAGDFLTVKYPYASGSIAIISALGMVEFEAQLDGGYSYINLGGIPQGAHFLQITDADGVKTIHKFIKH
ncbi:hypothetical protein MASR2M18_06700 [Ignavibacteria bacterium]|nr:T9SS type A sorting domain-containing protein [Bacteroidota bacterium]MCZ2131687.1 T9SS type A sorting domain-containing protein [Bacteroidota bacterium]